MKKINKLPDALVNESAQSLCVQQHMRKNAEQVVGKIKNDLDQLSELNDDHDDALDDMLALAEQMMNSDNDDQQTTLASDHPVEFPKLQPFNYEKLESLSIAEDESWQSFLSKTNAYAFRHDMNLQEDPFDDLLSNREKIELTKQIREDYKMVSPNCDKYDYGIAAFCGLAAGLIDSFFVGMPGDSKLGKWSDKMVDNAVIKFANRLWHADKKNGDPLRKEPKTIAQAIGFLERRHKVNYDARYSSDLKMGNESLNMRPSDHHLKSLGHSPDIIGLFFSILDQFTGKASFISDGKVIRLEPIKGTTHVELRGSNFPSQLYSGFTNWIGHLMSDVAGSSGTRGHKDKRRGAGIPLPFFSLFQLCDFGSISVNGSNKTFAEFSTSIYESGYDARFGTTMAIPVALNELSIRLLWAVKSKFYHERSWKESFPMGNKPELRRMLVVGHGALCLVDGVDAGLRSSGDMLLFATRINSVAWTRFAFSALLEIRSVYNEKGLDIVALDNDLEKEWTRLNT